MEGYCLLICFLWITQLSSFDSPGPPAQGWPCPQWAGHAILIPNHEHTLQTNLMAAIPWSPFLKSVELTTESNYDPILEEGGRCMQWKNHQKTIRRLDPAKVEECKIYFRGGTVATRKSNKRHWLRLIPLGNRCTPLYSNWLFSIIVLHMQTHTYVSNWYLNSMNL